MLRLAHDAQPVVVDTTDRPSFTHWVYEGEHVAFCGTPVRTIHPEGEGPGVDCVVCLDLDREGDNSEGS